MDIDAMFTQARELARQGDRPAARRLLDEILQEHTDNEDVLLWHALVAPTRTEVIDGLHRVLEINPNNAQAKQRLAKMQAGSGIPASTISNSTPFSFDQVRMEELAGEMPTAFTTPDPVAAAAAYAPAATATPSAPLDAPPAAGGNTAALVKRLDHLIALQEHANGQLNRINRVAQFFFWLTIIGLVIGVLSVVLSFLGALSLMSF